MSTREITDHHVGTDTGLRAFASEPDGPAGPCNSYVLGEVQGDAITNCLAVLRFQDGPPADQGRNGVTMEALLAICLDRLAGFQFWTGVDRHNAEAMQHLERALEALKDRTRERQL